MQDQRHGRPPPIQQTEPKAGIEGAVKLRLLLGGPGKWCDDKAVGPVATAYLKELAPKKVKAGQTFLDRFAAIPAAGFKRVEEIDQLDADTTRLMKEWRFIPFQGATTRDEAEQILRATQTFERAGRGFGGLIGSRLGDFTLDVVHIAANAGLVVN